MSYFRNIFQYQVKMTLVEEVGDIRPHYEDSDEEIDGHYTKKELLGNVYYTNRADSSVISPSELHALLNNSNHKTQFATRLFEIHPYTSQICDEFGVEPDNVIVEDVDIGSVTISEEGVIKAVLSTDQPVMTLIMYSKMTDSIIDDFGYKSQGVLEKITTNNRDKLRSDLEELKQDLIDT